jgi:hypothetical protein
VWHTTHPDRWEAIVRDGFVKAEPDLPESARWGRPEQPGYVRSLGGISLFDFGGFEPKDYDARYRLSSWRTFVPFRADWGEAIWLKIDIASCGDRLISGLALLNRWRVEGAFGSRLMPEIEAAVIGDLSVSQIERAIHFVSG